MPIDFSSLNTGFEDYSGGMEEDVAPEPSSVIDYSDPHSILTSKNWINASSRQRLASAPVAFEKFTQALEEDKSRTIRGLNAKGEEVDKPLFDPSGNYNTDGREYLERAKTAFDVAAQMEDGGAGYDDYNKSFSVNDTIGGILTKKREKQPDRFSDMGAYIQEKQKITKEGESPSLTYKEYTDFANAEVKNGEAHLDPENKEMEKAFYAESAKRTFDPSSLGDDVMIGKVGDQYVMNPKNFNQIDKMEAAINGLDLSASDKKMMLIDYRSKVEENIGKTVNQFAAADAGVLGSIVSSPLRDEFMEAMSKPGASGYEFLKANKDRMDKDSYGVGSEIAGTFRDAMMATGTGALWLASAGNYTSPAEAWGGLAEDTAGAYHNGKAFELFGVDINRRDLTELTGQIGSFVAMGGMGALAGKGLTKVGAAGASRYAVNEAGVLLSTVAKTEAAAAAGTRTLGQKTLAGLKAIGTDPEVWLGSLQASGTSFGKTFNQEMNLHGDREKALKAANIEATSDGLSAFIATSVMNRVSPGMGKAFGMGDGAVGGGFIQNLKNKALTRESMEAVKETIENLGGDAGAALRTQFAKDLKGVMNTSARQLGLKGLGVLGNMGAESVEESADEIISDVIGSMLDDSKTWTEDVWGNIGTKWKEYVKAGVLGAVGGAMGDASGTVLSPKQTFGKSEGYDIQQGEWNRIKENVEKFSIGTEYAFEGLNGEAKSVAEYIAMPKPEGVTEQEWIQKKSQALVSAAKGRVRMSVTAAMAPTSPDAASVEPSATAAAQASPKAQGEAGMGHSEGSLGHIMELTGVKPPEGKVWRKDVRMAEDGPVSLDKRRVLTPLFVESSDKSGRVDHVGAKLVTTENGVVKSTEYLSPEQAAKTLVMAGGKPRTALIDGFKGRATRDTQYEYDEWSEKQDGAGDGAGPAKPPAKQEGAGNSGATQGAQYRAASGSRQIVSSPIAETLAPSERLKQQKSQQDTLATLDDHLSSPQTTDQQRVVLERLKQVHGNVEVLHDPDANDQTRYRVNGESFAGATSSLGAEDRFTYQGGEASESVKARNKQQTDIGTKLHSVLEGWQAGEPNNHKPNSKEWQLWKGLERVLGPLKAAGNVFLSETVVFDYENQVAGKMDMLMISPDGTVTNIDMKTLEPKKKGDPHSPKSAYNQDKAADRGGNGRKSNQHDAQATMLLRMLHSMGVPTKSSDGMILFVDRDTGAIIKSDTGENFRKIDAAEDERVGIHFKKEPKQLDFSPTKEAPSATPAAETKKPTPPTDENQTETDDEAQAEDEGDVLAEETAGDSSSVVSGLREDLIGENKIGKSVKVNERDPSIKFLGKDGVFVRKSNNEVVVTDEALTAALERHNGDSDAAFDDILQQIDDINGEHSSLSALDPSAASGASTLTHQEVVYVAKPELITGGTDELGGRWMMHTDTKTPEGFTPKSPTYSYVPPKGQSLTLGVGQVVAIGDNPNEVLMVTKVFKGTWEFEKVSLTDARFDLINNKGKINQNNRWARTRLENVGVEFKDLFPKIVDKTITKKEMEGLFKAVLKIVSPNKDFKVVEKKLSGSDYVYADPVTKAITVDYGQLASKFAGLYGSANINEFSNALLGLDAARVLSSILDEEIVHLLGYEEFTRAEVLSFHKSILALPKDSDGKNHPFHAMFLKTLEERFPGEKLNSSFRRKDENGKVVRSIEDGVYTVTSELMRKLHQLATSGTTTERATSLSRELQRMIFADGTEVAEKRSPLKVIGHMLRRYAERIRNILWMKWQQGTLTPEARQMLARLNAAYRKAGIQGDVDYGYHSATEEAEDRLDKYETAFKDEVGSIARFNSPALIQLRKVIGNFSHLSLEELLVVDRENMTLQIHDEARRYITDHKLMDLDEVDEVLAKLNDTTSDSPSYQKAMTVAFLKQQVMELKRDNLSFDPSKLFDEMRSESNGDVSKLGLWFDLLAGMPRNQISLDEMLDPLVVERNVVRDEVEMVRARAIAEAFKAVEAIDTKKGGFKAIKQLIQWGELSQVKRPWSGKTVGKYSVATNLEKGDVARPVTGHSLDAEKLTRSLKNPDRTNIAMEPLVASIEQGVEWEKKSPQEQLMDAKPEELAKMLADYQKAILQSLKLSMPLLSGADHKAFSKALGDAPVVDALARLNETETNLANLSENIQTLRDNGQRLVDNADVEAELAGKVQSKKDKRKVIHDPSADNVMGDRSRDSVPVTEEATRLYRQYIEFSKSVEDYNDAIQFVKRRALGDFTVNNRGYGLNLYDLNVSEGKGTNLKYTSYTDKLTPATTSDEVFQGVVEDKLPTDDNRFAYGYASRFFYPKEVDGVKQPLTDYQQSWNDGLEIYRSKMSSNADFIGKASFLNFWVNKQLGNIRSIGASDSYEQTGGFSFEKIVNDGDAEIYVSAEDAFPDFAAGDLGSIKRGLGFANGNSKPVLEVVKFIQSVNEWSQKVRSNYQDGYGSSVVETIGGEQTIAARMVPMLDKFFSRLELVEDDRIATVVYGEGLDSDLKTFFGSVVAVLQNHFEISDDFMVDREFSMPDGQIDDFMDVFKYDENGQLVKRKGDATTHAAIAKNLSEKFFGDAMTHEGFSVKLRNSVNAVKLVRKTMRGFQKPEWRKNVEKEGSRVQRDPAYDPDNVAMLKLRENVADARILGNLGWAIEYFEKPRDYVFGANWAFELLKGIEESNYGDGREPFVRVTQSTKGRETTPKERFDFSEGEGDPNNRFVAGVNRIQNSTYSEVNSDSQVVGPYDYAGEDDSRVSMFTGGESVSTVKGYKDTYNPGGNSTPFESSQRAYGRASVSRAMKLTVAALFIGSNSTAGRSSAAGRQFYFDMMRAERESGWFTAEDVIGERAKVGPKPFGMVTDPVTGQNQSRYSDAEIEGMEQDELHRVFSRAMNDNLLRRGLQGLFPSFNATGAGRFSTAIYDAFLSEYGRTNGNLEDGYVYEFHNSEKFITDLLSFKTKFERMVVERARVKNGDDNVSALKTVLAATNEPSEQFSNLDKALKKKDGKGFSLSTDYDGKLSKRPNNFVSDSEATAIAKLIHEGMMVEKYVLADTRLGTGMGTGNGMIDHLVDALPGRTMVLSIDVDRAARSGLKDVGLRVFQGDGKTPNVIYFPTSQSGHRFQGERAGGVIAQLLRLSADGNPKVADKIREMAGTIRESLNPVNHANEGLIRHRRGDRKQKYFYMPSTVGGMSTSLRLRLLRGGVGRHIRQDVKSKVSGHMMDQLVMYPEGLFPGISVDLASDIVLISEVLSSEDAKVLLDDAHAVIDSYQDTELPHQVEKDIMDSIRHVRMKGLDEVGRFGDETDQISDEPVEDENEDPEMTVDGPGELQDITDPLEMSENPFLADRDLDEAQQIIEQTGETNPEMARVKRMQDFGQSDRSDIFLFNGVAAIVQAGKALNGEVSEEQADGLREKMDRKGQARDDTARSILGNETLTGKNEREKLDVARAGAVVESPMDKAGRIYVGEAKNLTMPKAGGRTALNLAFYDTRINNTNASMLHRVGSIEAVINEKALTEITQALQKKSRDNKEYNARNEALSSLGFSRQDVKIELTDALVDELKTTLPKGVIEAAMAEVRESVDNLESNKERLQGVLAGLKQSREDRVALNAKNFDKNWKGTSVTDPGLAYEDRDAQSDSSVETVSVALANELLVIDRQIARVERDLLETREALSEIDHHPSVSNIGRTYFRGEAGVAAQVDQRSGKVLGDGVDKALRSVGINLSFYAPGTNSDTEQERWHDFTSDEAMADTEMKARRREHYIREQAVTGALTKLSTDHIDDAYRLVRNTTDNFLTFDPLKVIRQAVDMAQVESLVMKDQMGLARTDAETAEMRGLSADAVAMLTDPLNPDKVEALTRTQQNKMKILNLPKSSALRREKIGSLFNQEGQAVVLVPTTVREQLMRAFPHRVTKRNVESVLSHTALRAMDLHGPSTDSIRFNELTSTIQANPTQAELDAWKGENPAEYAELKAMRERVLKAAGYNRKGVRFGFYVDGVPLPPSIADQNFGPGYYVAEDAILNATSGGDVSVSSKPNKKSLEELGLKEEDVKFRIDEVFVKAHKPIPNLENLTKEEIAFIEATIAYESSVNDAYIEIAGKRPLPGMDKYLDENQLASMRGDALAASIRVKSESFHKVLRARAMMIRDGRLPYDSVRGIGGRALQGKTMSSELVVQRASQIKSTEPLNLSPEGQLIPPSQWGDGNSHSILHALDPNQSPGPEIHSYFFGTVDAIKDEAFNGDDFSLTKGKTLTKEQAGKVFSGEYVRKLQVFLDAIRNQSNPEGKKKVDLSQRVTQAQIKQYGFMIERLAMVYNDEKKLLSEDTKKQVGELLTAISDSGLKSFSMIEVDPFTGKQNTLNMMRFRVEEAFSKVFSEVEGELISNRLASGMSIHNGATSLFAMKYLHHQDARIRNRFRRTYAARQTALHLNAFLERGMDGKSGRSAYQTSKKEAQDTIAESAKLVGNSALDQTLGYFHSILSGLDHANGLDYLSAFKEFVRQGANGFNQMDDFVKTQNGFYGKNKLAKYWNGTHIDMVRDHELSMKVRSIIKKSIEGKDPTTEAAAREIVERVQSALLSATTEGKRDSVKNYSETLSRVLGDIDTAMHVTMAMLSKEGSDPVNEAKSKWKHNEVRSFKRTYSSVPMKFGYAGRPGTKAAQVEGRYVSDAIDIVAFDDASFFGGIGRSSKQYDDKSVYRPISVNGLVAPLSLIDDAIYRLNVTPTYEVLRRSIGQVVDEKGVLTVQDGGVLARLQQDAPDPTNPDAEYHRLQYEHDKRIKAAKTALASVANELEQVIHNDSQVGVVNTGGAEVLRFMSSAFIVRSLASVQQMWDQTSGPSLGYVSGKIAVGKPKMAATYMKIIGMYLSKKQFRIDAKKFIMATAPPVYYRSSDGRDVVKDESRGQKRFGGSNAKNISGKLVRQYEKVGEDAIHFTIGAGERMLATASFLTELMDQMKIDDLSGLLKGEHGDKMNIMHVVNSQQKVNDMMAQSDQSKKSWMFQSRETSPGMSALWRALVQFSNHTSSMASNMTVMMPMALSKVDKNAGKLDENGNIIPPMEGFIDQKSHEEALENVVTTLVQNILFAPFKAKVLVPVLAYIIARTMMGDDDEDAVRNAQEMANNVLAPQEDGNVAANFAKMLVFGKQREFFRSDMDEDAAFASAVAEIGAKSLVELATTIPVLGVAAGYSPVSGLAQKLVLNDASESTVALLSGLPKSKFYFDDGGVQVRSYDGGWADNATGITAPTSAAMDMAQAAKLLLDYNLTSTAGDNRVDSSLNSAIYAFTELVPFLRDARGHMKGVLSNVVKEEQD